MFVHISTLSFIFFSVFSFFVVIVTNAGILFLFYILKKSGATDGG